MNKTVPRSARICAELIASIAEGALRPGDPIYLTQLCRRHRVSRTVVREAVAELARRGLVLARPGIGTEVAPESRWNLLDTALIQASMPFDGPGSLMAQAGELRRVIEPAIAADAARHASRTARAGILHALRRLAGAIGAGELTAQPMLASALHEAIAAASPNRMLGMIDRTLSAARVVHYQCLQSSHRDRTASMLAARPLITRQTGLGLAVVRGEVLSASSHALDLASLGIGLGTRSPLRASPHESGTHRDDPDGPHTRPMHLDEEPAHSILTEPRQSDPLGDPMRLRIPSLLSLTARTAALER